MGAMVIFGVKYLKADILVQILFTPKGERFTKFVSEGFNSKKELYRFTKWIKLQTLPEDCEIISDWLNSVLTQTLQYRIYRWKSYRSTSKAFNGFSGKCYNNYTNLG